MQSISFLIQRKFLFSTAGLAVLLFATGRCQATTYYVAPTGIDSNPGTSAAPFKTIQHGIDTAADNDTIVVAAGAYPESITWSTKSLTLQGAGAGRSIIDPSTPGGGPGGRCMYLTNVPVIASIAGFTFENGSGANGGGMYNDSSSPTVTNCTFLSNSGSGGAGGGMFNISSSPTVINCSFSGNSAGVGGGIYNRGGSPTVTNCSFSQNSVPGGNGEGGGMFNYDSNSTVTNCSFSENTAPGGSGGGMESYEGSPVVTNCSFSGNSTSYGGGGMYNYSCIPTVTNCSFGGNSTLYDDGGGMFNGFSTPTVTNCSFSGNRAPGGYAGAMYNTYCTNPTVTNCIFWGDTPAEIKNDLGDPASVTYSDVQGGYSGTGNINADPLFVRNALSDGATDYGDLHLRAGSPCIDAGNVAVVKSPPFLTNSSGTIIDLDGNPRIENGDVNMGAYEFQKPPIANPGSNQVVEATGPTTLITLDGSKSSDPDGDTLSYRWTDSSNTTIATTAQVSLNLGVGTYTYTLTVTDPSGAWSSASVQVIVQDTTPPTISGVPSNFSVAALKSSGAVVTYTSPTATDRVDGTVAVTCTPASGSTFPLGVTTVTCTATDAAGNKATATFQVNVTLGFRPPILRFNPLSGARLGSRTSHGTVQTARTK